MSRIIKLLKCNTCEKGPCFLCQYNFQDYCYPLEDGKTIKWEIVTDNLEEFIKRKEALEEQIFYYLEQPPKEVKK